MSGPQKYLELHHRKNDKNIIGFFLSVVTAYIEFMLRLDFSKVMIMN